MLSICNRLKKPVEHHSQLSDDELYVAWHLQNRQLYITVPDIVLLKRTSDLWTHKTKLETIKTYADYFEHKLPNVSIHRDSLMATVKAISNPRINYLHQISTEKKATKHSATDLSDQCIHYPIELLHYGPVNQADLKLFYKLPSILVRLTQLYWIEQLRIVFASEIKMYKVRES
ncbi:unnamed protein product [Rotaria sp. Silwood1]|nr:unnamed protein product [Rotaria sp. Silwood1]CAF3801057.1 unnamed protein product [Rotaria sp. Silwood1]CAF4742603.1 unnamed protein product [Rotaria sp. Silwood1]CAF4921272.1 unnamed protein product [Rotaria sp. Silwood1]